MLDAYDIEAVNELKNIINSNIGFVVREYKSKSRTIKSQMNSVIRQYSEYGDVTSKAREIIRILDEVESGANTLETKYKNIVEGLKNVISSVKQEEKQSSSVINSNRVKLSSSKMDQGIFTSARMKINELKLQKEALIEKQEAESEGLFSNLFKEIFSESNLDKFATLKENAAEMYEKQRAEQLEILKQRLVEGKQRSLSWEEIAFYENLPDLLKEQGISLTPEAQRNLLVCLHIKGNIEEVDLKRFGVKEGDLAEICKAITLKYDPHYYEKVEAEKRRINKHYGAAL